MKLKITIILQILLILGILTFGGMLDGDRGSDALRSLHRAGSMLASVVSIVTIVMVYKSRQTAVVKALAGVALLALFTAGFAGSELANTDNYSQMFDLMRGAGFVSLVSAIALLVAHIKSAKK